MSDDPPGKLTEILHFIMGMLADMAAHLLVTAGLLCVAVGVSIPVWSLAGLGLVAGCVGAWLFFRD
ncbi:hypothetical protein EKE94_18405 [Mesobaculum littorinae]|uniref:Uncharacterized protein n=1 Tax=Mesobaculum littorinae TaxID=2486419 RepID=A0A438ACT3_9RHOB|nr:hypothetical protein [Mesobaculum littorinae]RVV96496.1 hypothetical protein EKE94_18405 [Mesobaculum littorinae]